MGTAFDMAVQALFSDANLAVNATFIPLNGANKSVRVITRAPDLYQDIGQSVVQSPSLVLEVRITDCPDLMPGDRFLIGQVTYVVQGEPRRDSERLVWQADCHAS